MARFRAFASDSEEDESMSEVSSRSPSPPSTRFRGHGRVPPRKPSPQAPAQLASPSSSTRSDSEASEGRRDGDGDAEMGDDEDAHVHTAESDDDVQPWPQQLNLESQRVHVMQTSLFRMPELARSALDGNATYLKHPRPMEVNFEGRKKAPVRTSFSQPRTHPPPRKYIRIAAEKSVAASREGTYLDAGLSFGRSFRVGWGPGNKMVHVGNLVSSGAVSSGTDSTVNITTIQLSSTSKAELLEHLLSHSKISAPSPGNSDAPSARPNRDLDFASFASLFHATDNTHLASTFRLGHALFDDLDDHLDRSVSSEIKRRVATLRRINEVSSWLQRAVSATVDQELKAHSSSDASKLAFIHLTGNQIEKAVEVLIDGGDVRLATLVSQYSGDPNFRNDVHEQLQIWKSEKVDVFISDDMLRLYALGAGEVNVLQGNGSRNVEVSKGLDWLRAFGLQMWYCSAFDTSLRDSLEEYEERYKESKGTVAGPTPWYSKSQNQTTVTDGLFSLLKLALVTSITLESTLVPLSFSPNPRDFSLCWFLYVLLSRSLGVRDFSDRRAILPSDDESMDGYYSTDGYSMTADVLTSNFASQLEQEGLVQEAAFVLLFLEDDNGRRRAIKDLLGRFAPRLTEYDIAGLQGSLRIPRSWIDEAKGTHALYTGDVYGAYELYKQAGAHQAAYELAINYLAPEAVLREDLDFLEDLFTKLDESLIPEFSVGGQLFIDYVSIVSQVPELKRKHEMEDAVPDAAEASQLEMFMSRIPKVIGMLPDVLRDKGENGGRSKAALSIMLSNLLSCLDASRAGQIESLTGLVDEAARLQHIHAAAYSSFMQTITVVI